MHALRYWEKSGPRNRSILLSVSHSSFGMNNETVHCFIFQTCLFKYDSCFRVLDVPDRVPDHLGEPGDQHYQIQRQGHPGRHGQLIQGQAQRKL